MTQPPQDMLERMVSDHLKTALDPQRGRAAEAFRRHLENAQAPRDASRLIPRRALWLWAGVPSALAAGLAVAITLAFMRSTTPPQPHKKQPIATSVPEGTIRFDQMETSNDLNGGITMLGDHTPVRLIHRQTVRHTEWLDPNDHATYSVTEPIEKVGYVKVQPY